MGGGFGSKLQVYGEEVLAAWAARRLRRPVKWVETRAEAMMVTHHGRDQVATVRIGAKRDGTVTAFHAKVIADLGAYMMLLTPAIASFGAFVMSGCYRFPAVQTDIVGVMTNTFATDAIRGAGRPEATHAIEVMMDQLAQELDMDPVELRRRNFIAADAFPYETAIGVVYDSGNYTEICGMAPSRVVGPNGFGLQSGQWESAMVRVHVTGAVTVYSGASPHGQGHETGFAQIVADKLGCDHQQVEVIHGDTSTGPQGLGTYGSRTLTVGGEAVAKAADKIVAKGSRSWPTSWRRRPRTSRCATGSGPCAGRPRAA